MILKLLPGATYEDLQEARAQLQTETVPQGVVLMALGDHDPTLVIVEDGELVVDVNGEVVERTTKGAILGEVALFTDECRHATVTTATQATISILTMSGYKLLRYNANTVAFAIERLALMQLGSRVLAAEKRLTPLLSRTVQPPTAPSQWSLFLQWFNGEDEENTTLLAIDKQTAINDITLFKHRKYTDLVTIVGAMESINAPAGTRLQTEGQQASHWYIIMSGIVEVRHQGQEDDSVVLSRLRKGKFFGLTSAMAGEPNYSSCVTTTDCTLLSMTRKSWLEMFHDNTPPASTLRVAVIKNMIAQLNTGTQEALDRE